MQPWSTLEERKEAKKPRMVFHRESRSRVLLYTLQKEQKGISTKGTGAHQENQTGETKKKKRSVKSELLRWKKLLCIFSEITALQWVKAKEWNALGSRSGLADRVGAEGSTGSTLNSSQMEANISAPEGSMLAREQDSTLKNKHQWLGLQSNSSLEEDFKPVTPPDYISVDARAILT